jgi:hypothetical protein
MSRFPIRAVLISLMIVGASYPLVLALDPPVTLSPLDANSRPAASASPQEPAKPGFNLNIFNPAIGFVLDMALQDTKAQKSNFDFRSAELNLSASVDPFVNLYAVITSTGSGGLNVEEAAFMTTSLPYNLTVRGGRFFANFGRFPHWHDHELPFVNRTPSLDTFIGGESQADGLELLHLFKTPFFLQGTVGVYNKLGADNNRLDQNSGSGDSNGRTWNAMTYLQRLASYIPMGDDYGLDLGASNSVTPKQNYIDGVQVSGLNSQRWLTGADMTFRYEPLANNAYRKLLWGTEIFHNTEQVPEGTGYGRQQAWGGYSYTDWRWAARWSSGGFFDFSELLDTPGQNTKTYGVMLNFHPSEFQRLRLQFSQERWNNGTTLDNQVYLQWTGAIGTHIHVFKDR